MTTPKAQVELDSERITTGKSLYDRELERRLEMRRYATIDRDLREVRSLAGGGGRCRLRGILSLHGEDRAIESDVSVRVPGDSRLEVEGEKVIDMRDFELDPPRLLMLRVYPALKLRGRIVAERDT